MKLINFNKTDEGTTRYDMNLISISDTKETTITTDFTNIKRIIKKYFENFHDNKSKNLDEIGKFLERQKLPKLTQGTFKEWINAEDIKTHLIPSMKKF